MTDPKMPSHHGVADASSDTSEDVTHPHRAIELLLERASCRSYTDDPIPAETLDLVLKAGVRAASGGNLQPTSIIQIENQETKDWLAQECGQSFIGTAPVLLVFCLDFWRLKRWAELEVAPFSASSSFRHFWISFQDTALCAQSICTAADALGLGSCYIGTVLEFMPQLCERLALPEGVLPVVLLTLGVPKRPPKTRLKLDIQTMVHKERYHQPDDEALLAAFERKYPGYRVELTEERADQVAEVGRQVHGPEFAERCRQRMEEQGYINAVQRYFGLHYCANEMPQGNDDYLALMRARGFHWFEPWTPK
jgi:FMN reductase [NAD(P)H]